jgi:formamidase
MAVHEVRIDRSKTLLEQPATGHNRWHPDIPPIVHCAPGDEVVLETRDAFDGQMGPQATLETVAAPNLDVVHPLTGPVYVEGAQPGDLLEVEILEVVPDSYGYTVQVPGFGFLRDVFTEPFMVRWAIADGWATSDDLPGVRIRGAPFMGTIGLSPGSVGLRRTRASPPRRCAPSRRVSRRAMSTSSSWPPAPACSSRWTRRADCSLPATRTSLRVTARRAARRSR